MGEYIEREAAQKIICGWCGVCRNPTLEDLVKCDDICPQFAKIPAADVRPVVLCRDCKHWDTDWTPDHARENEHFCPYIALTTREDWFCADGEKREES